MRIVTVQRLQLSRGKGLLSHHYSAPFWRTSWVVGPSTRGHSRTSVYNGQLRCWRCNAHRCERCLLITESHKTPGHYRYLIWVLECPLTLIFLFSQSFFLPLSLNPHSLTCLRRRLSRCTSTGTLLVFCRNFPRREETL